MTRPVALLLQISGLSQREAADFLCVRLDTVKSWSSGRNPCPDGVIDDLRDLVSKQARAADEALAQVRTMITEHGSPDAIDLGEPLDDDDAQSLGWPCIGAWRGMAARIIAGAPAGLVFEIVPRGSTPATAAAMGH